MPILKFENIATDKELLLHRPPPNVAKTSFRDWQATLVVQWMDCLWSLVCGQFQLLRKVYNPPFFASSCDAFIGTDRSRLCNVFAAGRTRRTGH